MCWFAGSKYPAHMLDALSKHKHTLQPLVLDVVPAVSNWGRSTIDVDLFIERLASTLYLIALFHQEGSTPCAA